MFEAIKKRFSKDQKESDFRKWFESLDNSTQNYYGLTKRDEVQMVLVEGASMIGSCEHPLMRLSSSILLQAVESGSSSIIIDKGGKIYSEKEERLKQTMLIPDHISTRLIGVYLSLAKIDFMNLKEKSFLYWNTWMINMPAYLITVIPENGGKELTLKLNQLEKIPELGDELVISLCREFITYGIANDCVLLTFKPEVISKQPKKSALQDQLTIEELLAREGLEIKIKADFFDTNKIFNNLHHVSLPLCIGIALVKQFKVLADVADKTHEPTRYSLVMKDIIQPRFNAVNLVFNKEINTKLQIEFNPKVDLGCDSPLFKNLVFPVYFRKDQT